MGRRCRRRVDARRRPRRDGRCVRRRSATRGRPPAAPTRRTSRRASGTRSATTPRSGCTSYAYDYMKIIGEGVGDWAARRGHLLHSRRVARAPSTTRATPAPTSSSSCPPPSDPDELARTLRRARDSEPSGRRQHARRRRGRRRARRLRRPVVPRRARSGVVVGLPTQAELTEIGMLALEGTGRGQPRQPPAGHRLAPDRIPGSRPRRSSRRSSSSGMPRSGTTALSHLLAADPDNRSLLGVGGERVDPAADHHDLRRRPPVRRRARTLTSRRRAAQPRVQGDPPRRARRRHGVHGAARAALPEPHLSRPRSTCRLRRVDALVRLARRSALPPIRCCRCCSRSAPAGGS